MKITFSLDERVWLHTLMLTMMASKSAIADNQVLAVLGRLRNKFAPNAPVCWLNGRERKLVMSLAEFRRDRLAEVGGLTDETKTVESILEKVSHV